MPWLMLAALLAAVPASSQGGPALPAATEVPAAASKDAFIVYEKDARPIPAPQLERFRAAFAELRARFPGILRRVVVFESPRTDRGTSWGTAGDGELRLNRITFDYDECVWLGIAVHEFGHLVFPTRMKTERARKAWDDLYTEMWKLELEAKSPILTWFAERNFCPRRVKEDIGYKFAGNSGEMFAMLFVDRWLWAEPFDALVAAGTPAERRLMDMAVKVCPSQAKVPK